MADRRRRALPTGSMPDSKGSFLARPQALLPSRLDRPSMKAHRPTTPRRKMAKPQLWAMSPAESDMLEILIQRPSSAV
ncbi:hypothetical protein D3C81_2159720 [compost metagenome]